MLNFEDREETKLIRDALMVCLELNLMKSKKVKDKAGELIDILTKLYDYQKEDYGKAVELVLSSIDKEDMGKC